MSQKQKCLEETAQEVIIDTCAKNLPFSRIAGAFHPKYVLLHCGMRPSWTHVSFGFVPIFMQALLQSSHMYAEAKHSFRKHGVLVDGLAVDLAAMQKQKVGAVEGLTKGIEGLFKKNKVCLQQEVCILPCV